MITKINFLRPTLNFSHFRKNKTKNFNPNFRGILDDPQAKRVTNGKGTTYIVEPGGHIVVHETPSSDKTKTLGAAAATGAGTSVAASKISDMRHSKEDLEETHANHDIEDSHNINSDAEAADDDDTHDIDDTNDTIDDIDNDDDDDDDDDDLF